MVKVCACTTLIAALLLTSVPAATQDAISLERVAPTTLGRFVVARGERIGFAVRATSPAGGLHGAAWYLSGGFLGVQHRSSLSESTEYDATFWRGINFFSIGSFQVEAEAFDRAGQYSSPVSWTVQVVERPRLLYVNEMVSLLAAPESEQSAFWAFVASRGINQLAIYRLHEILGDPSHRASLRVFIAAAHARNVTRVFAVVGAPTSVGAVRDYLNDPETPPAARFDGLLTEHEFWNPEEAVAADARWGEYLRLLAYVRVLADEAGLVTATYLGRFSVDEARSLRELVDLVLLHVYIARPEDAYTEIVERLERLSREWSRPVEVWPILYAECIYMGRWFSTYRHENAPELAETVVLDAYRADARTFRNGLRLAGFAYYARTYLVSALGSDACVPWRDAPPGLSR